MSSINSSEIRKTLDKTNDKKLLNFYKNHKNVNEYKDIKRDGIINKNFITKSVFAFIQEVLNTFDVQMENKNRQTFEIKATVDKINHSDRNFYVGCANCCKKMANDYCFYCSTGDKKIILNLSIFVQDATSSFWIDIFGESAKKFI